MKKYFAMMVAVLFLFGVVGVSFAQTDKQDAPAKPIEGQKTEKSKDRQQMTPDKEKAYKAPAAAQGQAKPDTKKVKKSEKSKKRQQAPPEKPITSAPGAGDAAKP